MKTVHLRHLNVKDYEIYTRIIQGDIEGLLTRCCLQDLHVHVLPNQAAQREQVIFDVINDKNAEASIAIHDRIPPPLSSDGVSGASAR